MKTLYILGFDYQDFVKWRLSVNGKTVARLTWNSFTVALVKDATFPNNGRALKFYGLTRVLHSGWSWLWHKRWWDSITLTIDGVIIGQACTRERGSKSALLVSYVSSFNLSPNSILFRVCNMMKENMKCGTVAAFSVKYLEICSGLWYRCGSMQE